jgi:Ca-activated chloride channel homolog
MTSSRGLAGMLLSGICLLHALPAAEDPKASFVVRVVSPDPLHLAGRCRVMAAAEWPDGRAHERIAWMTLWVDAGPPQVDSAPPFVWDLDLPGPAASHSLRVEAVDRDGVRASLSVLSSQNPFVERVGVDLVLVPVVVREQVDGGAAGRLVTGLSRQDFAILEDGVPQPLTVFSREAMPLSLVVALDTSASMERSLWSAQKALIEFLRVQAPGAVVSLLAFNDQVFLEQDFTADRETVASAVMGLRPEGTRTALADALRIGSAHLSRREGARVLVLFTDGQETVYEGEPGRLRTSIEAALASDVSVYAVAFGAADLEALQQATERTGGETVVARGARDLRAAFERIAESIGGRYVLGYELSDPQRRGHRAIEVRVARPAVRVFSRTGVGR